MQKAETVLSYLPSGTRLQTQQYLSSPSVKSDIASTLQNTTCLFNLSLDSCLTGINYKNVVAPEYPAKHNAIPVIRTPLFPRCVISISQALTIFSASELKSMSYSCYGSNAATWQERLEEKCREAQIHPPVFQIVSDRRGGRTAWSSTVTIQGQNISARYWYDGQYVNNAKEDAAEVALKHLTGSPINSPTQSRSGW